MKKFLLSMLTLLIMCSSALAERVEQEIDIETGKMWGFPTYVVTFEVSDPSVAEVVTRSNGGKVVRFIDAGDVYVWATFYSGGRPAEVHLYLFHVSGEPKGSNAVDRTTFAREVLELVNVERAKVGASPLRLSDELNRYADVRAREIVKQFSHTRPNGANGAEIIPRGKYRGENLAAGAASPRDVVEQWMNSPGHRENILFADYEELGVGYCYQSESQYRHYWVQLFRAE